MAEKAKTSRESGFDRELMYLIMGMLFIVGCWLAWTHSRHIIVYPAFMLDWIAIKLIEAIKGLGNRGTETLLFVENILLGKLSIHQTVDWDVFMEVRTRVGMQTRFVIAGIISCCALLVFWKLKRKKFNRTFSLAGGKGQPQSFNSYQAKHWKVAAFSASFDPDSSDNQIEPAYTPMEWLQMNQISYEAGSFDRDLVLNAFVRQLGQPWHGFGETNLAVQTVLVLCALHLLRRKDSLDAREIISCAWANNQDGKVASKQLVEQYSNDSEIDYVISTITSRHGFENTAVIGLLTRSREIAGVLASSDFLWLRKVDRNLWYAINNTGRRRFHIEGAAVMAHFFVENLHECALIEPQVLEAVNGLEEYLDSHDIESLSEFQDRIGQNELASL